MKISWIIFFLNSVSESSLTSFSSVKPVNAAFHKNLSSFFCCPTAYFVVNLLPDCCPILLPVARGNKKRNDATYSYIQLHPATQGYNQQQQATTMSSNIRIEKTCEVCGNKYIAKRTVTRSCSLTCARLLYKRTKRNEKIEAVIQKEAAIKPFNPIVAQKEFLTVAEACQLINASRWTIYRLIDNGQLKAAKLGRNTRIARTAINQLFNTNPS